MTRDWRERAACADTDPETFYPGQGESTREALTICHSCPVSTPCLNDALAHGDQFGIWGGLSVTERRKLRRRQRRSKTPASLRGKRR